MVDVNFAFSPSAGEMAAGKLAEPRQSFGSERYLRDLLQALPIAVYTTDAAGHITFYNEAAVELSGRRPQIGTDSWCVSWRLYQPDGTPLPHEKCPMAVALRENRPVRGSEAVAERPDGTLVPFIPYPTPLHDTAGNLIGAVNTLVDISHRKDAETRQRMLFDELNHRMKNTMQMLHGLLKASQRQMENAQARDALSGAVQRVGALAAAQKVLYQAGNASAYDAREFIAAVCDSIRQSLPDGVQLEHESVADTLSNDTAAPLALIVNELVTNAVKHGTNGESRASIRVLLTKQSDVFILQVADHGGGFDLDDVHSRSSGLGLVMGLVKQIGGTFSVERSGGACCTVCFRDEPARVDER